MKKLFTNSKIFLKINISNLFSKFKYAMPQVFQWSFWKCKLLLTSFTIIYSIFLIGMLIAVYKSYYLALNMLNEQVYQSLAKDISTLNWNHPIKLYSSSPPCKEHIDLIYGKLGIINYKDYVYNLSSNSQHLRSMFQYNPVFESQVSSVVLSDIVQQNTKLFADLAEEVVKRIFRLTIPLTVSSLLLGGLLFLEKSQLVLIAS